MDLLWNGILLGLTLSILVGPILFALIQTSIEYGFRRGLAVGIGIWISDVLYIAAAYFGMAYVTTVTNWSGFEPIVGSIGGLILMGFGIVMFVTKPPALPTANKPAEEVMDDYIIDALEVKIGKPPSYFSLWLKGFLINTVNPFTVLFWSSITTTIVIKDALGSTDASLFYGGILGTIILTDILKIWLAKRIRTSLRPIHILRLRQISGAALFVFGIVLMVRVFFL